MHVLLLIHTRSCGEAEKHVLYLAKGLLGRNVKVTCAGPADAWLRAQFRPDEVSWLDISIKKPYNPYNLYSLYKLVRYLRKKKVDLFHSHMQKADFLGMLASGITGIPHISTAHSAENHRYLSGTVSIIAVSDAVNDILIKQGYSPQKIRTVHNGILLPERQAGVRTAMRKELGIAEGEIAICMAARFARVKGHDIMLRALEGLTSRKVKLYIAGEMRGKWYSEIRRMAQGPLEDKVIFLGHRNDINNVLQAMDIYAAPSRKEGLGLSILEAMSLGLPVVATAVGGIPEIIENGVNGFIFVPGNEAQFGELLDRLCRNPNLSSSVSARARATVVEKFSIEKMCQKILEVYNETLKRDNGRGMKKY